MGIAQKGEGWMDGWMDHGMDGMTGGSLGDPGTGSVSD